MKATTVCASVLSTLILGGMVVSAAESPSTPNESLTTHGHVEVKTGNIKPDGGVIDPEEPGVTIPDTDLPNVTPNPNENMGPLEITHAPKLEFGVVETSNKDVRKYAEANNLADGKKRGAILQFGDLRTDASGYTVTATMTKQFTKDGNELKGATIAFTNPHATTKKDATGEKPTFANKFELVEGEAATVATADEGNPKEGKGMWVVEYGSSKNVGSEDTTEKSVQLTIPANTASSMASGNYVSDIEWAISAIP